MQLWILDITRKRREKTPRETLYSHNAWCVFGTAMLSKGLWEKQPAGSTR